MLGDIPVLPGLVVLAVILLLIGRRIRAAAFVATAGVLELATYRVTSLIIHRERPLVPRLDDLPGNQSYPSGHVAASVAVYGALALVLTSRFRAALGRDHDLDAGRRAAGDRRRCRACTAACTTSATSSRAA